MKLNIVCEVLFLTNRWH